MTDTDLKEWTNYLIEGLKEVKKVQIDIYNKLDELEKTVYEKSSKYIGQNIFFWVCGFLVMGVVSLGVFTSNNKTLIEKNYISIEERVERVERREPSKVRHYKNERTGTETIIEYYIENK